MDIHSGLVALLGHYAGRQQARPSCILAASIYPLDSLFSVLGKINPQRMQRLEQRIRRNLDVFAGIGIELRRNPIRIGQTTQLLIKSAHTSTS